MAVLFMDGFDHYQDLLNECVKNGWTTANTGTGTDSITGHRFATNPGRACDVNGGGYIRKTDFADTQDMTVGFAWYSTYGPQNADICTFYEDADLLADVWCDASGRIKILDTTGTLNATGTETISANTWYYFEIVFHGHATTGTVKVYVNGDLWVEMTSGNTAPNAITNGFELHMFGNGEIDDVYVTDDLTKLDAPRIITLIPTGQGTQTAWTGDHDSIDDPGGTTTVDDTYISSSTAAQQEGFTYENLPSATGTWTVLAVKPSLRHINSDSGTPTFKYTTDNSAGDTAIATGATYNTTSKVHDFADDSSLAWTVARVDSLEITVEYE